MLTRAKCMAPLSPIRLLFKFKFNNLVFCRLISPKPYDIACMASSSN